MKSSDRAILMGVGVLALLAAAWFLLLSPKREEASKLGTEVASLQDEVDEQEALVSEGNAAKEGFDANYQRLVVLGKAVPEGADTSSLLVALTTLSRTSKIDFRGLTLIDSAAPVPTGAEQTTVDGAEEEPPAEEGEEAPAEAAPAATPVAATEAASAAMPIGAVVGPAGLPVMPYTMEFGGDYFEFAKLLGGFDALVSSDEGRVTVDGRLVTVDGFSFAAHPRSGFPDLVGTLAISTYVVPAEEGLLAGATPTGPTPVTAPVADPAAESTATSTAP